MRSNADQNACTCTSCAYLYAVLCDEVGRGRVQQTETAHQLRHTLLPHAVHHTQQLLDRPQLALDERQHL